MKYGIIISIQLRFRHSQRGDFLFTQLLTKLCDFIGYLSFRPNSERESFFITSRRERFFLRLDEPAPFPPSTSDVLSVRGSFEESIKSQTRDKITHTRREV